MILLQLIISFAMADTYDYVHTEVQKVDGRPCEVFVPMIPEKMMCVAGIPTKTIYGDYNTCTWLVSCKED